MDCIICLDNCNHDYIQFPNNLTNCRCKYNVHESCLNHYKKYNNFIKYRCFLCRNALIVYNKNIYDPQLFIKKCYINFIGYVCTLCWTIILFGFVISPLIIILFLIFNH